jgi:hypothetical protein
MFIGGLAIIFFITFVLTVMWVTHNDTSQY